ncbi:site-specific integrase, partial [Vibrio sp. 10N.261.49.A5]
QTISKQIIHIIHADLSKTVKGSQSKQDEFVTTEVGKKAYEILQALHSPLRKRYSDSKTFFHKVTEDYAAITKDQLGKHIASLFEGTLAEKLVLTN